jgi:magnesium chelatase accessory protein
MTAPDWNREGRNWPNRDASRFVEAGGVRFHVQLLGAGPPVLLLHGTGAATHSWAGLAAELARNFTVIAPDLPGHGFSEPLKGLSTLPEMASAMAGLCARLEVRPALVVGHSAGAAIAVRMTLDQLLDPLGIVSLNGALLPFPGPAAELFPGIAKLLFLNPLTPRLFAFQASLSGDVGRFLTRSTGSRLPPEQTRHYSQLFACSRHVSAALEMMANWDLKSLKRDLARLDRPLFLVAGSNDLAVPPSTAREVAALVPCPRIEMMTGLGHLSHEEEPVLTARLIEDFARSLPLEDSLV